MFAERLDRARELMGERGVDVADHRLAVVA